MLSLAVDLDAWPPVLLFCVEQMANLVSECVSFLLAMQRPGHTGRKALAKKKSISFLLAGFHSIDWLILTDKRKVAHKKTLKKQLFWDLVFTFRFSNGEEKVSSAKSFE